uniref:R3H domain-containing protein n=1 Tax=Homalodisca liturata TaxID=320908 RepID=A0A1B6K0P0_9HEMI
MGFLRTPNEKYIAPEEHQIHIEVLEPSSSSDEEEEEDVLPQPAHVPRARYHRRRLGQAFHQAMLQAYQDGVNGPSNVRRISGIYMCRNYKVGRKRSRRLDNSAFLQSLGKQGEDDMYEDIIQQEPTVFERLLCDEKAMEIWESFTSQPEEEQHTFLTGQVTLEHAKQRATKERCGENSLNKSKPSVGKKCFKKICPHVQEFLNSENMPKTTLLNLEPRLIEFFESEPEGHYVSDPLNNDDRKVIHGLAQYLDLCSQSFNSQISYDHRCTRVTNPKSTFVTPTVLLSQFLGIR